MSWRLRLIFLGAAAFFFGLPLFAWLGIRSEAIGWAWLVLGVVLCLCWFVDPRTDAAMRHALEAVRRADQSGRIPKKRYATASSPCEGVIRYSPGE